MYIIGIKDIYKQGIGDLSVNSKSCKHMYHYDNCVSIHRSIAVLSLYMALKELCITIMCIGGLSCVYIQPMYVYMFDLPYCTSCVETWNIM